MPIAIKPPGKASSSKPSDVGYLEIIGTIEDSKDYVDQLEDFEGIPSIKGILVKIDSGGGVPGASEIIFKTLKILLR